VKECDTTDESGGEGVTEQDGDQVLPRGRKGGVDPDSLKVRRAFAIVQMKTNKQKVKGEGALGSGRVWLRICEAGTSKEKQGGQ